MKPLVRSLALCCLTVLLIVGVLFRPSQAVSLTDSRINQLEFQVRQIQTQLNRIANQNGSAPTLSTAQRNPNIESTGSDLTFDEQFDNLATMVIEINQRLQIIEQRLAETERS